MLGAKHFVAARIHAFRLQALGPDAAGLLAIVRADTMLDETVRLDRPRPDRTSFLVSAVLYA